MIDTMELRKQETMDLRRMLLKTIMNTSIDIRDIHTLHTYTYIHVDRTARKSYTSGILATYYQIRVHDAAVTAGYPW
jgi:hypothetical protein